MSYIHWFASVSTTDKNASNLHQHIYLNNKCQLLGKQRTNSVQTGRSFAQAGISVHIYWLLAFLSNIAVRSAAGDTGKPAVRVPNTFTADRIATKQLYVKSNHVIIV